MGEESVYTVPAPIALFAPGSRKPQSQDVVSYGVRMLCSQASKVNLVVTILASTPCLTNCLFYHSHLKNLGPGNLPG